MQRRVNLSPPASLQERLELRDVEGKLRRRSAAMRGGSPGRDPESKVEQGSGDRSIVNLNMGWEAVERGG